MLHAFLLSAVSVATHASKHDPGSVVQSSTDVRIATLTKHIDALLAETAIGKYHASSVRTPGAVGKQAGLFGCATWHEHCTGNGASIKSDCCAMQGLYCEIDFRKLDPDAFKPEPGLPEEFYKLKAAALVNAARTCLAPEGAPCTTGDECPTGMCGNDVMGVIAISEAIMVPLMAATGAGWGALLGSLIGFGVGGPVGAVPGAVAGGAFAATGGAMTGGAMGYNIGSKNYCME